MDIFNINALIFILYYIVPGIVAIQVHDLIVPKQLRHGLVSRRYPPITSLTYLRPLWRSLVQRRPRSPLWPMPGLAAMPLPATSARSISRPESASSMTSPCSISSWPRSPMQVGVLALAEVTKILAIKGSRHAQGVHIAATRATPRTGHKKATPVSLPVGSVHLLKSRHDRTTAIGRHDKLLMCLLLDLGLRCGEIALLRVEDLDLAAGTLSFYRPKVDLAATLCGRLSGGAVQTAADIEE